MSIEIIGIDHIYITVSNLGCSEDFYDRVMTILGFRKNTFDNEGERHPQNFNFPLEVEEIRDGGEGRNRTDA